MIKFPNEETIIMDVYVRANIEVGPRSKGYSTNLFKINIF